MAVLTGGVIKKVCVEPYYLAAARRSRITLPAVMAVFLHCRQLRRTASLLFCSVAKTGITGGR
jgi:hypothetical protein